MARCSFLSLIPFHRHVWVLTILMLIVCVGCEGKDVPTVSPTDPVPVKPDTAESPLRLDPATGIPVAVTFSFPVASLTESDFGFGFGDINTRFCLKKVSGKCTAFGAHLGRDTIVGNAPVDSLVVAPADGIVRITSDVTRTIDDKQIIGFQAYGADFLQSDHYYGCAIVLEHVLQGGSAISDLLGHVKCENESAYDPTRNIGNPPQGLIVRRGQYLGHVNHYYDRDEYGNIHDWPHLHWGIRRGRFQASSYTPDSLSKYVSGYDFPSNFTTDQLTKKLVHPVWIDPAEVLAGHKDPATISDPLHHPSGSLLVDPTGAYWQVINDTQIAPVPNQTFFNDRYAVSKAAVASSEEMACYAKVGAVSPLGPWAVYKRPLTNTLVVAYFDRAERYDFIRWEAYVSWGLLDSDIQSNLADAGYYETFFAPKGYRLLRPGTLVKGDAESEVAIVSAQQTRIPIASGDAFERLGFKWSNIVTIPQGVLTQVAGPRSSTAFDQSAMTTCAVPPPCPGGGTCGGGGEVEAPESGDLGPLLDGDSPEANAPSGSGTGGASSGGTPSIVISTGGTFSTGGIAVISSGGTRSSSGGSPSTGGMMMASGGAPSATGGSPTAPASTALRLVYTSPICGPLRVEGWWHNLNGTDRPWAPIAECVDPNPADCTLDCIIPVPSGTPYFEFQAYAPNNEGYGNEDCYSGGCGKPLGELRLYKGSSEIPFTLIPNPSGAPYYNEVLQPVP
jgi:hypothetical protein